MRSLISQERATRNGVGRSQISVAVTQADIAGDQVDLQINQIWDLGILDAGHDLNERLASWDGNCGPRAQFERRGATAEAINAWDIACRESVAERAKFIPIYKEIVQRRAELQSFQSAAESRRKALVDEASKIE